MASSTFVVERMQAPLGHEEAVHDLAGWRALRPVQELPERLDELGADALKTRQRREQGIEAGRAHSRAKVAKARTSRNTRRVAG